MSSPAVPTVSRANKLQLNQDVSYLLTGGLGGLGRLISTWLVERGARSLVFLSRSADSTESHGFLRELESTGCTVTVVPGKAESAVDIHKAISKAPSPIRGVIHLAIVLKDSSIATMTHADWHAANAPKVNGAWNIHLAFTSSNSLDFFVLASSLDTVVEQRAKAATAPQTLTSKPSRNGAAHNPSPPPFLTSAPSTASVSWPRTLSRGKT